MSRPRLRGAPEENLVAFSLATPCCTLPKMQSQRFRERLVSDGVPAQLCWPAHHTALVWWAAHLTSPRACPCTSLRLRGPLGDGAA